jgi:hypothetical protein
MMPQACNDLSAAVLLINGRKKMEALESYRNF